MIIVVAPGQGSQTPGFLSPWLESPQSRELLQELSDAAQVDLAKHGSTSDAATIRDTAIAQPLIVAAGLLTLNALEESGHTNKIAGIAGHSVGEFTAAAGAGVLSNSDAIRLVGIRGRAMAAAASKEQTGMSAVIGGEEHEILLALKHHGLTPANYNGGGQLVVAGPLAGLAALAENPPAGSRVIPLQVAGAFHTEYMSSAVNELREASTQVELHDPSLTLWTNRDGSIVTSGSQFIDLMVGQVSSPVRWDLCMQAFGAAGVTGIIELCPAGALVGLAKRALKGVPTVAIKTPDDLEAAHDLLTTD